MSVELTVHLDGSAAPIEIMQALRKVQVDAYYALGDEARGRTLLQAMIDRFPADEDVRTLRKKYNR